MNETVVFRCPNIQCRVETFKGVAAQPPFNCCPVCQFQGSV